MPNTPSSDVLERLRAHAWGARQRSLFGAEQTMLAAIVTIERLSAELERKTEALFDIRNRILCPVGPSPTLDEVEAIASAALTEKEG